MKIKTRIKTRKCNAAVDEVFIANNGDVYPCPLFQYSYFRAGNIQKLPLSSILKKPLAGFEKIKKLNMENMACNNCDIQFECNSGCRAAAYSNTNSLFLPNIISCLINNKKN
ncbi:MAG: hypothetical protein DRJ01_18970, partial [Bacteroidetes bacterium]